MRQKILFIVNPKSGTLSKTNWISMATRMLAKDFDLEFKYTTHRGHACELAQQAAADRIPIVVAVGGDGTVNEIASSLVGTDTALAILPLGSGNGLARELGISTKIAPSAISCIKHLNFKQIDYGRVNDVPFFCTCGVGFDAQISYEITQRSRRGLWMYVSLCVKNYFHFSPLTCTFEHDGITDTRQAFMVNCANIRQFGFNAYIAPRADLSDGKLSVTVIKPFGILAALRLLMGLFTRRLDHMKKYVETFDCERVTITTPQKTPLHCDGDYIGLADHINVEIVPNALKVVTP
jgi:diacylglycerol kinase (ATP)